MQRKPAGTQYRVTSRPSDAFFDSRLGSGHGIGFPSACRDLVPAQRNTRDPHDYYAELGVDPGASRDEVRRAVRALYVALHPDTGADPDPDRLNRVHNIAEVLLDDQKRLKYDNTPEGSRLMDKNYAEELRRSGKLKLADERIVREALKAKPATPYGTPGRFDYFSIGTRSTDSLKAQQWYHFLLTRLPLTDYTGRIRLLLWDNPRPAWEGDQEVLMVPRSWNPSAFAAEALLTKVIGSKGVSHLTDPPAPIPGRLSR